MRKATVLWISAACFGLLVVGCAGLCLVADSLEGGWLLEDVPTADALFDDADADFHDGRFERALKLVDEGLELDPLSARGWCARGATLSRLDRRAEEEASYARSLAIDPEYAWAHFSLAHLHEDDGDWDAAFASMEAAFAQGDEEAEFYQYRGWLRLTTKTDVPGARADFDRALELDRDHFWARQNRGWLFEESGDFAAAEPDYRHAIKLDPEQAFPHVGLSRCLAATGRSSEAIPLRRRAAELDPEGWSLPLVEWRRLVTAARKETGSAELRLALVQAEVAELRSLEFLREVEVAEQSVDDFGEEVQARVESTSSAGQRDDMEAGLRRLGMLPRRTATDVSTTEGEDAPADDLASQVTAALKSQVWAYYDPDADRFTFVAEGLPIDLLELTAAHELVHALQDQHFDLGVFLERATRKEPDAPRNDDALLAARCVAEGEATFVQTAWQLSAQIPLPAEGRLNMTAMALQVTAAMDLEQLIDMSFAIAAGLAEDHPLRRATAQAKSIPRYVLLSLMGAHRRRRARGALARRAAA